MKANDLYDKLRNWISLFPIQIIVVLLLIALCISGTHYLIPESSFASDSLMKILQAKGWIESDFGCHIHS
ncbi:hypothetical protein AB3N59_01950 [Leptospira sp. WS92.C1]